MADDDNPVDFAVYITDSASDAVSSDELLGALNNDSSPEDNPFVIASDDSFRGRGAQSVIEHHRNVEIPKNRTHRTLLLIADRTISKGVLMVDLEPYHGYPDAVRQVAGFAGDSIASMSIANTDWYENREADDAEQIEAGMIPKDRFALYNTLPPEQSASFETALKWMNDGVGELGVDNEDDEDRTLPIGAQRSFYRSVSAGVAESPSTIMDEHASRAPELDLDAGVLAIVDAEWESKGIIVARVSSPRTSFRCKTPVAGEILNWTFIGLMTWEEAEAQFAA